MAKESKILAIDIGSDNLKMAEFYFPGNEGGAVLTGFLFRKIERTEGESERDLFERNYYEMLSAGGFTAKHVRLSLSAQNSFQRLSKLPPMLGSRAAINRLVEFEASQTVPCSMDEVEWDYQLLHHEWDENVVLENPDGSKENTTVHRDEYESLFVAMKSEDVVCYSDVIEDSGKVLLSVELAPVALFNAALAAQVREDESVLLLNIGGHATSLMISDHRRVFMRNIPIGGDAVTAQVAREFGVSSEEAEDFKRRYGFVALGGAYDDPESELAATISKLARNVMTRLHGEISRSISVWRAQHGGSAPARVLLCGGGSTMLYTTDFFQEKLRLPTEYLNTFSLINIAPEVDRNQLQAVAAMFQELIGLAMHNLDHCPIDISLLPRAIKKQKELDAKKPYFYAAAVALISCLLIFVFGVNKLLEFEKQRVTGVEADVKRAQGEVKRIQDLNAKLSEYMGQYEASRRILDDRTKWAAMVNELQKNIPDRMWLVSMEYVKPAGESSDSGEESGRQEQKSNSGRMNGADISDVRNIEKIRLVGYTLDDPDHGGDLVRAFTKKFDKSEVFQPVAPSDSRSLTTNSCNLTNFEIFLTLKEPIKK